MKHELRCKLCGKLVAVCHEYQAHTTSINHLKTVHPAWWKAYQALEEKLELLRDESGLWMLEG